MATNGWSNGVNGPPGPPVTSLPPSWEAGGVLGGALGRGRGGFAPGRGRGFGAKWAQQQQEERPVGSSRAAEAAGWSGGRANGLGGQGGLGVASDMNCFRCKATGHLSRECPTVSGARGPGRPPEPLGGPVEQWGAPLGPPVRAGPGAHQGGQRNKTTSACYKCGGEGHISKDCPSQPQFMGGGGRAGGRVGEGCYTCGEPGHFARECRGEARRRGEPRMEEKADPYIPDESLEENLYEHGVGSGINFRAYQDIPVKVTGISAPDKIDSFGMMGLDQRVLENIIRSKYREPTPVQKYAIPMILSGRDVMGCAQTGSGKTAAFLIPIVQRLLQTGVGSRGGRSRQATPEVVIMSPTRELAIQIKDEARKFCNGSEVRSVVVYGGTSTAHQAASLEEGCNILVATPGRWVTNSLINKSDFLTNICRLHDYVERGKVSYSNLQFLVLDEADRMLDMGFKDDIIKMVRNPDMPGKGTRRTMMFSATFPDEIQKMAFEFLADDYLFLGIGRVGGACRDVAQAFEQVEQYDKREKLLNLIRESPKTMKTLVFVETKKTADFLASYMCQSSVAATSIHGDRQQRQREEALRTFKLGETPVLVATAVAARGLDIKGVEHVVNYDLPSDIDEYVHRIGRTGRVGNTGRATSFYDRGADGGLARPLLDILAEAQQVLNCRSLGKSTFSSLPSRCPTGWRPRRGGTPRATRAPAAARGSAAGTSGPTGQPSRGSRSQARWRGTRAGTS